MSTIVLFRVVLICALGAPMLGQTSKSSAAGPLSSREAIADFQVPAGLRVELVAAEPDVVDPVAIAFDEDGRMWVVEMRDYPTLAEGQEPASRIRILRDCDGDGRYESATTFADGLLFPTGVQPWRGGVIATLAGEVAYFPDANRDDKADSKETWYRGFVTENEQLRANHPTLGHDGLVYVAGGLRGGEIVNVRQPDAPPISINGRDFAFDPDSGECMAVTGNGQFGMALDDFDRRFTCSNRNPLIQVMIEQRYLERNPRLVLPEVVQDVAASGEASRVFARTRAVTTATSHAGQFTAACGVEIYRGDALAEEYYGNAFVCEPTASLVHREIIDTSGAAFSSTPSPKDGAFLSSSDEWFRPVNVTTGPDGALYVVDMCRAVIEHPDWMPVELRGRTDVRDGADRGRIYRVMEDDRVARLPLPLTPPRKGEGDAVASLSWLEHPNGWQRSIAARLIREAGTADAGELRRLAIGSKSAATRGEALWLLLSLKSMDESTLLRALADESPDVRQHALVLAESRLAQSDSLRTRVLEMASDSSARVRYQVALSLSMLPETPVEALVEVALRDLGDMAAPSPEDGGGGIEWTSRAVALASRDRAADVLTGVLQRAAQDKLNSNELRRMIAELATATVATSDQKAVETIAHVKNLDEPMSRDLLLSVSGAMEARGKSFVPTLTVIEQQYPESYAAIIRLFRNALATATDNGAAQEARVEALRLLRHDLRPEATNTLLALVSNDVAAIQIAAIAALASRENPEVVAAVLTQLPEQMPSVRRASLDLLLANEASTRALLEAIEADELSAANVDAARAELLKKHADEAIRDMAQRVLGSRLEDRAAVVTQYQPALKLAPDRVNGRKVFAANCATCHRLGGEGTAIGPDIGDSMLRKPEQLLADILQPNLAVDANYVNYAAVTQDGRVFQGVIRTETGAGIALATAEGKTVTLERKDLESLTSSGTSMMPDGLEKQISTQQMADLIDYIRNFRELTGYAASPQSHGGAGDEQGR